MMYELDELQLENDIINLLKRDVFSNVMGSYPSGTSVFPLITTSMNSTPKEYDISKNIVKERVSFTIRIWETKKTSCVKTRKKVENVMLGFGFTRNNPTEIIVDRSNDKYYTSEQFNIIFNKMTNQFERSL